MLRFHLVGDYRPGAIACSWAASSFHPDAGVQELIDRTWDEAKRRLGGRLFDGPMCRLESYEQGGATLRLVLSRTSYKPFLGTNLHNAQIADRLGPGALANPVGASCALVAADGYLMMGRRNSRVAYYPNRIHPFAGAIEPREPMDVFDEIRRELAEELALEPGHIAEIRCLGMAEDCLLRQPELIFLVHCTLTGEQIAARVDQQEHQAAFSIDPTPVAVEAALGQREILTPIAVGTVLLWARGVFGAERFSLTA